MSVGEGAGQEDREAVIEAGLSGEFLRVGAIRFLVDGSGDRAGADHPRQRVAADRVSDLDDDACGVGVTFALIADCAIV